MGLWPRKPPDEPWAKVQCAVLGLLDLPDPLRQWLAAELITVSSGLGLPDPRPAVAAHRLLSAVHGSLAPWRDTGGRRRRFVAALVGVVPTAVAAGGGLNDGERELVAKAVRACS